MEIWLIYTRAFIIMRESKYLLLLAAIAGFSVALGVNSLMAPKYDATVVFRVTSDPYFSTSGVLKEGNPRDEDQSAEQLENQKKIAMDRLLTREVMGATLLLLGDKSEFLGVTPDELLKNVSNSTTKGSETFRTTVEASTPVKAKQLADSLARAYIEEALNVAKADRTYIKDFLDKRFSETEAQLKKARDAKEKYLLETSIVDPNKKQVELLTLNRTIEQEAISGEARAIGSAAEYRQLLAGYHDKKRKFELDQDIGIIKDIRSYISELEVRRNYMATKFTPANPQIVSFDKAIEVLKKQLADLENNPYSGYINADIEKEIIRLSAEVSGSLANARALREKQQAVLEEIALLPGEEKRFTNLSDAEDVMVQRRTILTNSLEQAILNERLLPINVRIASNSELPLAPISPNKSRNILIFTIAFVFVTMLVLVVREVVRQPVRTIAEAEKLLNLKLLTAIPQEQVDRSREIKQRFKRLFSRKNSNREERANKFHF